jgi:hypothetical protein
MNVAMVKPDCEDNLARQVPLCSEAFAEDCMVQAEMFLLKRSGAELL